MPFVIELDDLRDGYLAVRDLILAKGERKSPRGMATTNLRDVTIVLNDPTDALPTGVGRRLNTNIALLEAVQLIAGMAAPIETINRVAPRMAEFAAEPDGSFHGNYGERIGIQMLSVERKLKEDRDTRQAVVNLWDGRRDNARDRRDYPCTLVLIFEIINDKLVMATRMRSNDFLLGLAQDAFQFTQLQLTLAAALGIEAGPYHHNAWSLHIYDRDLEVVEALHESSGVRGFTFKGIGLDGQDMFWRMTRAGELLRELLLGDMTPTEAAYANALR